MKILVTTASRHGSTEEIGKVIAKTLRAEGVDVVFKRIEDVESVEAYDAFIIGSAIYMGKWLKQATRFIEKHNAYLSSRKCWLFSSGPIGNPLKPSGVVTPDILEIARAMQARGHRLFTGSLNQKQLGRMERVMVRATGVEYGDYRMWGEVVEWALEIEHSLQNEGAIV